MFRLIFFEPCIPPNTGNAIRLAANTGCELHLVEPLGFDMDAAKVKRAGLDYHDMASVTVHPNLATCLTALAPKHVYAFTAHAPRWFTDIQFEPGDCFLFGPEPTGLPPEVLADPHITEQLRIPMLAGRRSHNLANSASIVIYEAWRQHGFAGAR